MYEVLHHYLPQIEASSALARLTGKADAVQRLCGNLQIDSGKAISLLGWRPKLSVAEGLRRAVGN